MKLTGGGVFAVAAVVAVGLVAYTLWKKKGDIAGAAAAVGTAINPLSDQNLAYKGANAAVQAVTGVKDDTVGGALWRLVNPGQEAADNTITAPSGGTPANLATAESLSRYFSLDGFTLPGAASNPDDPLAFGYTIH